MPFSCCLMLFVLFCSQFSIRKGQSSLLHWLCVLKRRGHLVLCPIILTFKMLLKSQIFTSPQGKTLRRDLYLAFPFVKHLLYLGACSEEELLRGPWSHYQWTYCRSVWEVTFFVFSHRTMEWKGYFGLLKGWI